MTLCEQARALIAADTRLTRIIAAEMGVSTQWVHLFKRGQIKSPSVDLIEKVFGYYGCTVEVRRPE